MEADDLLYAFIAVTIPPILVIAAMYGYDRWQRVRSLSRSTAPFERQDP